MNNLKTYSKIDTLKNTWNLNFSTNTLNSFESLKVLEKTNFCKQSYIVDFQSNTFIIKYLLNLNLFTFKSPFKLKIPLSIVGMPFSVSTSGYTYEGLQNYIKNTKGFNLILNSDEILDLPMGYTLPTCLLNLNYNNFSEYLNSMRSSYRYRLKKAIKKGKEISISRINNKYFTKEHYKLYLEVYENSEEKLEKLHIEFFRNYPSEIYVFEKNKKALAFVQLCFDKDKLYFLFGGFKKKLNLEHDLYFNMLLFIVKYGIDNNYSLIDFGQTAEESKLKIGCTFKEKYMYFSHHNKIINYGLKKLLPLFSYKPYDVVHKVFKE